MAKKSAKKAVKKAAPKAPKMVAKKAATTTTAPIVKARKVSAPKNSGTKSYTMNEVYENVRGFCGLAKRTQAKEFCEDMALFLVDSLKKGYKVPFMGLGKLFVRTTKPRMGRNPATGEMISIPAKKRVRFTASKALKQAVL